MEITITKKYLTEPKIPKNLQKFLAYPHYYTESASWSDPDLTFDNWGISQSGKSLKLKYIIQPARVVFLLKPNATEEEIEEFEKAFKKSRFKMALIKYVRMHDNPYTSIYTYKSGTDYFGFNDVVKELFATVLTKREILAINAQKIIDRMWESLKTIDIDNIVHVYGTIIRKLVYEFTPDNLMPFKIIVNITTTYREFFLFLKHGFSVYLSDYARLVSEITHMPMHLPPDKNPILSEDEVAKYLENFTTNLPPRRETTKKVANWLYYHYHFSITRAID